MLKKNKDFYEELIGICERIDFTSERNKEFENLVEQWNNPVYSLREILDSRYLDYIVSKGKLEKELKEYRIKFDEQENEITIKQVEDVNKRRIKRLNEEINHLLKKNEAEVLDRENYIKYRTEILFKILDVFIVGSKEKLRHKSKKRVSYFFNEYNRSFINNLLDLYEEKNHNYNLIIDKKFDELDDLYINMILQGVESLVQNQTNALEENDIRDWRNVFEDSVNSRYIEVKTLLRELEEQILHYANVSQYAEDFNEICDEIVLILKFYNSYMEKTLDAKLEYPNLGYESRKKMEEELRRKLQERMKGLEEEAKQKKEEREKRSERAKEGWRKRKKY